MIDITTAELRKSLGEIFDRVFYNGESYIVLRKGRPIGAIIPAELAQRLQTGQSKARQRLLGLLHARKDFNQDIPDDEIEDLAVRTVHEVRTKRTSQH